MQKTLLYTIIVLLLIMMIGGLFMNSSINKYKSLYNDCINSRSIDTIFINKEIRSIDTILQAKIVYEQKREIVYLNDSSDAYINQYKDSIIDQFYVDRTYQESFGDSLVTIDLTLNATGKINWIKPYWKFNIPYLINRVDTVKIKDLKNQYFLGLGVQTDTSLNASFLFINKKRTAFSLSVNTLDIINKKNFPTTSFTIYHKIK